MRACMGVALVAMTHHELKSNISGIGNSSVSSISVIDISVDDFEVDGFFNALMLSPPVSHIFSIFIWCLHSRLCSLSKLFYILISIVFFYYCTSKLESSYYFTVPNIQMEQKGTRHSDSLVLLGLHDPADTCRTADAQVWVSTPALWSYVYQLCCVYISTFSSILCE